MRKHHDAADMQGDPKGANTMTNLLSQNARKIPH